MTFFWCLFVIIEQNLKSSINFNSSSMALMPSISFKVGLHTVPSDRYRDGRTIYGQMTGTAEPSTVHQVCSKNPQRVWDGYGTNN